ncbi:MAG TPA: GlsB/YeaQ/YmgE family stress response membrane protein [Polyangium sp.]|nr:GlsB/YeaQ/YmgE family stress response membrane protein [Polyangium sp.]
MMAVLMWVLFGLVVGVIAKLITPGREPGGFAITVLLGIGGALVGGFLSRLLGVSAVGTSPGGFLMSIIGSVVLLAIYNIAISRRMGT